MAAVAYPSVPAFAAETDEELLLSPPKIRNPYTPPPHRGDRDINDSRSLHRSDKEMNGYLEVDTKGLQSNSPQASAGRKRKKKHEKKDKSESLAGMLRRGIVDHQLGLSLNAVLLVGMSWCLFPRLRDKLQSLFMLSYTAGLRGAAGESLYGQGPRDLCLVLGLVVIFTGVRAFMLDQVLMPLAGMMGIDKRKARVRFAEQSYLLLYYIIYWTWGVRIFAQETPAGVSSVGELLFSMWTGFPKLYVAGAMKFYYLSQLAFWVQQIVVIHIEARRHDHYQMLTHHFVTVALMSTSYGFRQWRVGNAILACMDVVDLVFPLAKILRYLSLQAACDACFALFVVTWIAARHVAYLTILWSVYTHFGGSPIMPYGTYSLRPSSFENISTGTWISANSGNELVQNMFQPLLNPAAETFSFNWKIRYTFLGLLVGLQCITLMWLIMIINVVIRVLRGQGADDTRSDAEDEDEDEEVQDDNHLNCNGPAQPSAPFMLPESQQKFIEVEADSTELSSHSYVGRSTSGSKSRPKSKGAGGFSSGLNLGEHKDILNRIGCLSNEQLAREREKMGGSSGRPTSGGR